MNYEEAQAILKGKQVSIPTIEAAAVVLTTQGADEIFIPMPKPGPEQDRAREAISKLPGTLRRRVKLVDTNGAMLDRITNFVDPVDSAVSGLNQFSPEVLLNRFAIEMLYHMALANRYRATSIDGEIQSVQDCIVRSDFSKFEGEARYRVSQIALLATSYEPFYIPKVNIIRHASEPGMQETLTNVLDSAEFAKVVATYGRLGYLRKPQIGLRRISVAVSDLIRLREFKLLLAGIKGISQLSSVPLPTDLLESLAKSTNASREFSPQYASLTPFDQEIYDATLHGSNPNCRPPRGSAFQIQPHKVSICGNRFLEEGVAIRWNPKSQLARDKKLAARARKAAMHILRT